MKKIYKEELDEHDAWGIQQAEEVSKRSDDPNKQVGAVITISDSKIIIAKGFNDISHRVPDREEILKKDELKNEIIIHAEEAAIIKSNIVAGQPESTIYVNPIPPCKRCAHLIIRAGITKVVFLEVEKSSKWWESGEYGKQMMSDAGLEVVEIKKQDSPFTK